MTERALQLPYFHNPVEKGERVILTYSVAKESIQRRRKEKEKKISPLVVVSHVAPNELRDIYYQQRSHKVSIDMQFRLLESS